MLHPRITTGHRISTSQHPNTTTPPLGSVPAYRMAAILPTSASTAFQNKSRMMGVGVTGSQLGLHLARLSALGRTVVIGQAYVSASTNHQDGYKVQYEGTLPAFSDHFYYLLRVFRSHFCQYINATSIPVCRFWGKIDTPNALRYQQIKQGRKELGQVATSYSYERTKM